MIILGLVLLIAGILLGESLLYTLGLVLIVVGVVLYLVGSSRPVFGRRHWY